MAKYYILIIIAVTIVTIASTTLVLMGRRSYRGTIYKLKDETRERLTGVLDRLYTENREEAIEELKAEKGSLERQVIEEGILATLEEDDKESKEQALENLEALGYIDEYLKTLEVDRKWKSAEAVDKLGKLQCLRAMPALQKALKHPFRDVRNMAAHALGAINDEEAIPYLIEAMRASIEDHEEVSTRMIKSSLIDFGERAIPRISEAIDDEDWRVRAHATAILAKLETDSVPEKIKEMLNDPEGDVRVKGVRGLLREPDKRLLPKIIDMATDESWVVRLYVMKVLGAYNDKSTLATLRWGLLDENWQVRHGAAESIGSYGGSGLDLFKDIVYKCTDRYAREQVVEEMQRARIFDPLIKEAAKGDKGKERFLLETSKNGAVSPFTRFLSSGTEAEQILSASILGTLDGATMEKGLRALKKEASQDENLPEGMGTHKRGPRLVKSPKVMALIEKGIEDIERRLEEPAESRHNGVVDIKEHLKIRGENGSEGPSAAARG